MEGVHVTCGAVSAVLAGPGNSAGRGCPEGGVGVGETLLIHFSLLHSHTHTHAHTHTHSHTHTVTHTQSHTHSHTHTHTHTHIWSAVVDNNRPLHIARRSSRIDPTIDNRFSKIDSMIENRSNYRLSKIDSMIENRSGCSFSL